jgi:hypothetical protein
MCVLQASAEPLRGSAGCKVTTVTLLGEYVPDATRPGVDPSPAIAGCMRSFSPSAHAGH